jgi:hypothetical protein
MGLAALGKSWKDLTHRIELLQLGVINAPCAEPEDHLGRKRVRVSPDVIDEEIWALQETDEHGLVLQVLVRHICLRSLDVEVVVYYLPYHAPGIAIFLAKLARQAGAEERINYGAHHEQHTQASAYDLAEIHIRTRRVDAASLIQQVFDGLIRRQNDHNFRTENERVHRTIFFRPFLELEMRPLLWHQVKVTDDW